VENFLFADIRASSRLRLQFGPLSALKKYSPCARFGWYSAKIFNILNRNYAPGEKSMSGKNTG
jgi:hypothetical protein